MTLAEARAAIGSDVLYRSAPDVLEWGVITSVNDTLVFVRYGSDQHSKATPPEALSCPGLIEFAEHVRQQETQLRRDLACAFFEAREMVSAMTDKSAYVNLLSVSRDGPVTVSDFDSVDDLLEALSAVLAVLIGEPSVSASVRLRAGELLTAIRYPEVLALDATSRRLAKASAALALREPTTPAEVVEQIGQVGDAIAALQSLDDIGPEGNVKAMQDMQTLFARLEKLRAL